jgi:hypothetical protein
MLKIPRQLRKSEIRFYLIGPNSKTPIQKNWNIEGGNNYCYYDRLLLEHLKRGGNYGVVTGLGTMIVLDFDDIAYYNQVADKLPPTFTVRSASKRMPHLYYWLVGGPMFRKTGVDIDGKRVLDIQAEGSGVVAPNSSVNRKFYSMENSLDIAEIELQKLQEIFKFKAEEPTDRELRNHTQNDEAVTVTTEILKFHGINRTGPLLYECPFHEMQGKGNLHVMPDGNLYCFHEQRTWNIHQFINELSYRKKR